MQWDGRQAVGTKSRWIGCVWWHSVLVCGFQGGGVVEQPQEVGFTACPHRVGRGLLDVVLSSVLRSCRTTQAQTPTLATVISTSTTSSLELEKNSLSVSGLQRLRKKEMTFKKYEVSSP